jgi:CheY-like chemotaxis protein
VKKILLIDDEALIVSTLTRFLASNGYDVRACRDGAEALSFAEKEDFDMVVSDIRMPALSGIETIQKLRALFRARNHRETPVILMSGFADDHLMKAAEDLKVSDFLIKPFDIRAFQTAVQRQLGPS